MKTTKILLILALVTINSATVFAQKPELLSEERVNNVAIQIPLHFEEIKQGVFLIEFISEAKKGFNKGGQLTVYFPHYNELEGGGSALTMSIFDRTDRDFNNWYNISNSWDLANPEIKINPAVAEKGIYIQRPRTISPPDENELRLSIDESQQKFNEFIKKAEHLITLKTK